MTFAGRFVSVMPIPHEGSGAFGFQRIIPDSLARKAPFRESVGLSGPTHRSCTMSTPTRSLEALAAKALRRALNDYMRQVHQANPRSRVHSAVRAFENVMRSRCRG